MKRRRPSTEKAPQLYIRRPNFMQAQALEDERQQHFGSLDWWTQTDVEGAICDVWTGSGASLGSRNRLECSRLDRAHVGMTFLQRNGPLGSMLQALSYRYFHSILLGNPANSACVWT